MALMCLQKCLDSTDTLPYPKMRMCCGSSSWAGDRLILKNEERAKAKMRKRLEIKMRMCCGSPSWAGDRLKPG